MTSKARVHTHSAQMEIHVKHMAHVHWTQQMLVLVACAIGIGEECHHMDDKTYDHFYFTRGRLFLLGEVNLVWKNYEEPFLIDLTLFYSFSYVRNFLFSLDS